MSQDAFSAGVEPGGLLSSQQIKLLVCYLLAGVEQPLPRKTVLDVVVGQGMANFFETDSVIDDLVRLEHIEEADGVLRLLPTGHRVAATLEGLLPYTLRQRSVSAALDLLARLRREQHNHVTMQPLARGVAVTCTIDDGDSPLLELTLRVADDLQAGLIRDRFLDDPERLYRQVLAVLGGASGGDNRRGDEEN